MEIAEAEAVLARATRAVGAVRPGSNVAQARDFLRDAHESFTASRFEEAFRLAVESQSYSRRALGGSAPGRTGRRVLHLRRRRRLAAARRALDVRACAAAAAPLRRRLREGGQDRLGRDHVLRRHAVHDSAGVPLRVSPARVLGIARKPDQDRLGRRQRLHVERGLHGRHRRGDRRDRPRFARVGRRRAGGQDGGHELPRPDDRVDGQGDGRARGAGEGGRGGEHAAVLREGGAARFAAAGAPGRQPDLRPEDGGPGGPEVDEGPGGRALPPPDLPLAPLRARRDGGGPRRPGPAAGAGQGLQGRLVLLARRRHRRLRPDLRLELRPALQDDARADRPGHGRRGAAGADACSRPSRWATSS